MHFSVLGRDPMVPNSLKLSSDAHAEPRTVKASDICDESPFAEHDGGGSSHPCRNCAHPLPSGAEHKGSETDTTMYMSIVHRLQEKVHNLQEALLVSNQCSSLLDSLVRPGETSMTEVSLQQAQNSGEGQVTRRMRNEWSRAVEVNNDIMSVQRVSSKVGVESVNNWMNGTSLSSWDRRGIIHDEITAPSPKEEEIEKEIVIPSFHPKKENAGDANSASASARVVVDPVILVDITTVMNKNMPLHPVTKSENAVSRFTVDAEVERLTAENVRLREESAEVRRELQIRDDELRRREAELAKLSQVVKQLQECNSTLKEEAAVVHRRCDDAMGMARASELKVKELTATIDSLETGDEKHCDSCAAARHEAEDAWREVRRLDSELRAWGPKERELQRLRVLMRFSELKKDSDRLNVIVGEMESAESERDRLREENRRCRKLLAEYRDRLEAAVTSTVMPEPLPVPAAECPSACEESEAWPHSQRPHSAGNRPQAADRIRRPQKPAVASNTAGKTRNEPLTHGRQRQLSFGRKKMSFFSCDLSSSSRGLCCLFGSRGGVLSYHRAMKGSVNSRRFQKTPLQ
ncbi:hypothetical protein C3747_146g16 [Trypanosoma cruzi]|uniref:Uncharacterized protein n=2 Tax=Trypanosoma cruzi TaxID=5693 RepID=Q4DRQ4_TRYCC|nr:hypothetical protein, conserved [Trypanosoma cruzi]EAN95219.1 hypothetical protein, conserved [Trypanosoma cruzi]PWV04666.1 hypothetical protein C3747_146g16 [Trypanosoma cruzi]RNC56041.1 hypothetical protein TcCL_ESM06450 [Trypanosoma cruzi]|eukprot:XP_817070.1 hypothetical protein [Trypanosoma cruzi strain CL Brener]